ncbi:MAG: adenylate/guanylate cyclase domain-containing protein [Planctomycetia bacterium]|nr:adenylate/guanylate cyclase domain-containing protein [Planctomycetia bacterium]
MARLCFVSNGKSIERNLQGALITIGRAETNDIVLADLASSSKHAQLRRAEDGWYVEDRGSRNHTFVNGYQVESHRLADRDLIQIGASELTFCADPEFSLLIDEEEIADALGSSVVHTRRVDEEAAQSLDLTRIVQSLKDHRRPAAAGAKSESLDPLALAEAKLLTLQRVSEKLVHAVDGQRLNEEILQIVLEQTRADRGVLCLLNAEGKPVPIVAHGLQPGESVRISRTVLKRLLDERCGLLISPDTSSAGAYATLDQMGVTSAMCVPLWTGEEIIGALLLESTRPDHVFGAADLELLLVVAHQASIGIQRGRLTERVEEEQRVRKFLAQFLDHRVVARISQTGATDDALAPREQQVTILFTDIVSFTKLSEGLPPTDVAAFVQQYLTAMTDIVFKYGGTIDKYIGDAIMALFGAPVTGEDDATAAVQAALEMRRTLPTITPPGASKTELRARFGINTGTVVVGMIGSKRRAEYTAIGDAVNVASRIQTFARPNEICIDEVTKSKVEARFVMEEIGMIDVKNRLQPLAVFKVLGERLQPVSKPSG